MGFRRVVVYSLLAFAVFYAAISFPEVTSSICNILMSVVPKIVSFASLMVIRVRDYCAEDMGKDVTRIVMILSKTSSSVTQALTPLGTSFWYKIVDALAAIQDNAMSYTEDGLSQILGVEHYLHQVPTSRYKLLSPILLVLWIVTGVVSFSRLSYNKFFLLMSITFLVHSVFGPVWCIQRLALFIGLCMWIGSMVANKPIPAAIAVVILFLLTVLRKWRKRLAKAKSVEDLVKFNMTIEQRMESLERKTDIILAKVEFIVDKIPDRKSCANA